MRRAAQRPMIGVTDISGNRSDSPRLPPVASTPTAGQMPPRSWILCPCVSHAVATGAAFPLGFAMDGDPNLAYDNPPLNRDTLDLRPGEVVFPASFAQHRLWLVMQLMSDSAIYNVWHTLRLTGVLDVAALTRALRDLTRRHESLRTRFALADGGPSQVVVEPHAPSVAVEAGPGATRAEC